MMMCFNSWTNIIFTIHKWPSNSGVEVADDTTALVTTENKKNSLTQNQEGDEWAAIVILHEQYHDK